MRIVTALILMLFAARPVIATYAFAIPGLVNGKPIRVAFNTCGGQSGLYQHAARRLGLTIHSPPSDAKGVVGFCRDCRFQLSGSPAMTTNVWVLPSHPLAPQNRIDGLLFWVDMTDPVVNINGAERRVEGLSSLPPRTDDWLTCAKSNESSDLAFRVPGEKTKIIVATGSSHGVHLCSTLWDRWCAPHTDAPTTLIAEVTAAGEVRVVEEMWASELTLGSLTLRDIPVRLCPPDAERKGVKIALGAYALRQVELLVDREQEKVHVRSLPAKDARYEHNRLGAVFVPETLQNADLVAHVAASSPAQGADIRNGDVLLSIGNLDTTRWRTDPRVLPLNRFWSRPAGTQLHVTLRRGQQILSRTVTLEEILRPDDDS